MCVRGKITRPLISSCVNKLESCWQLICQPAPVYLIIIHLGKRVNIYSSGWKSCIVFFCHCVSVVWCLALLYILFNLTQKYFLPSLLSQGNLASKCVNHNTTTPLVYCQQFPVSLSLKSLWHKATIITISSTQIKSVLLYVQVDTYVFNLCFESTGVSWCNKHWLKIFFK